MERYILTNTAAEGLANQHLFLIRNKRSGEYWKTGGNGSCMVKTPQVHGISGIRGFMPSFHKDGYYDKDALWKFFKRYEVLVIVLGGDIVRKYDNALNFYMDFPYTSKALHRKAMAYLHANEDKL